MSCRFIRIVFTGAKDTHRQYHLFLSLQSYHMLHYQLHADQSVARHVDGNCGYGQFGQWSRKANCCSHGTCREDQSHEMKHPIAVPCAISMQLRCTSSLARSSILCIRLHVGYGDGLTGDFFCLVVLKLLVRPVTWFECFIRNHLFGGSRRFNVCCLLMWGKIMLNVIRLSGRDVGWIGSPPIRLRLDGNI